MPKYLTVSCTLDRHFLVVGIIVNHRCIHDWVAGPSGRTALETESAPAQYPFILSDCHPVHTVHTCAQRPPRSTAWDIAVSHEHCAATVLTSDINTLAESVSAVAWRVAWIELGGAALILEQHS